MVLSRSRERLLRRIATRRGREAEAVVLLEGPRVVETALERGVVPSFAIREEGAESADLDALCDRLSHAGSEVVSIAPARFREFASTEAPQGILAIGVEPRALLPPPGGGIRDRCLLLDAVQDPGNVGTLLRSAAALGVDRVFALEGTADPWGAKAVRASAGLAFALPVHLLAWAEVADWLESAGLPLLVADRDGEDVRAWLARGSAPPAHGWALLVGNEGRGVRPAASRRATARLAIPLRPGTDSLNVSTAGAILLWALGPYGLLPDLTSERAV